VQYKYDCSNRLIQPTGGLQNWPRTTTVLPTTGPTTELPTSFLRQADRWIGRIFRRIFGVLE